MELAMLSVARPSVHTVRQSVRHMGLSKTVEVFKLLCNFHRTAAQFCGESFIQKL